LNLPGRILIVPEGQSLVNDATALIARSASRCRSIRPLGIVPGSL